MENSIVYLKGDIFSSPAEVIVNTVNTVGVMGKGLAAEFKKRYPLMFKYYKNFCDNKQFSVGQLWIFDKAEDYRILLFPTKKHWRGKSKIEYIDAGLKKFVDIYEQKKISSIAFPPLGCGLGGLNWEKDVQPLMEKYLSSLPVKIYIYLDTLNVTITDKNVDSQNSLQEMLNSIKDKDIFFADNEELKNLDLALLCNSGYLLKILIQKDDKFFEGFQVNGGMIRKLETKTVQTTLF